MTTESHSFGRRAARGAVYSAAAQGARIGFTILSTIVVARLLTPADYGVIAMAAPITGFILLFQNLGFNHALIQSPNLAQGQVNALFWINIVASVAIALVILAIAPLAGLFYDDARPAQIMAASAITVLITGSALQHKALLNRDMRYRDLSIIDVANSATTFLATVGLALALRSYWALWLGGFLGAVASAVMAWRLDRWRPSLKVEWTGVRALVSFGANITGFNLLNFAARNLDNVLIARFWGAGPLGLYDRCYKLMMFPLQNINGPASRIVLPILARLRDEPQRYRRSFLLTLQALSLVTVPGVVAAATCSDRLVPFLLGANWSGASPIFFWLSLAAVTQPTSSAIGWLFISSNRSKAMMHWGLVASPVTVASFVIGLPGGAEGVAAAYFVGQILLIPFLYAWASRGTPVRGRDLYAATAPTLVAGLVTWLIVRQVSHTLALPLLFPLAVALAFGLSLAAFSATKGGREFLKVAAGLSFGLLRKRRR